MSDPHHLTPEDHRRKALARQRERVQCDCGWGWPRPAEAQEVLVRELTTADAEALSRRLSADPGVATTPIVGVPPLLVLLRRSRSTREAVRACARLLLDAGADPDSHTTSSYGRQSALLEAVQSGDLPLAQLLVDRGATKDDESFERACVDEEFNSPDDSPFYDLLRT